MGYIASMLHTCGCADLVTSYNSHGLKFPSPLVKKCSTKKLSLPDSTFQIVKKENCCWLSDFVFLWIILILERICSQDFKTLVTTSAFWRPPWSWLPWLYHAEQFTRDEYHVWFSIHMLFVITLLLTLFFDFFHFYFIFLPPDVNHWTDLVKSISI